jgi:hypothetical protein
MDESLFTPQGLRALTECLTTGARSVSIEGKSMTFHSPDELIKVINQVMRYLDGHPRIRKTVPVVIKGFYDAT